MPLFYTPILQVRNNCALVYNQPEYDGSYSWSHKHKLRMNFKEKETYSGKITQGTKVRISRAIDMLVQLSPAVKKFNPVTKRVIKHQLSFITLTIPDTKTMYTPKDAHKILLKPFLRYFRDKNIITTYVWKAELQKRGQLHYHLTTPSIIPYTDIRDYWNYLMRKHGMLEDFKARHGHDCPNSTDIHQVGNIKNFSKYLAKEFCKTVQNETPTTGKLWDCSTNLKGVKFFSVELTKPIAKNILDAHRNNNISIKDLEQCHIIDCKTIKSKSLLTPVEKKQYEEFIHTLVRKTDEIR